MYRPLARDPSVRSRSAAVPDHATCHGTILVVDDERHVIEQLLRERRREVRVAAALLRSVESWLGQHGESQLRG